MPVSAGTHGGKIQSHKHRQDIAVPRGEEIPRAARLQLLPATFQPWRTCHHSFEATNGLQQASILSRHRMGKRHLLKKQSRVSLRSVAAARDVSRLCPSAI